MLWDRQMGARTSKDPAGDQGSSCLQNHGGLAQGRAGHHMEGEGGRCRRADPVGMNPRAPLLQFPLGLNLSLTQF